MLGTALDAPGGVAAVLGIYRDQGFFERWDIAYVPTNCSGTTLRKFAHALLAVLTCTGLLLRGGGRVIHVHTSSYSSFWRKSVFFAMAFLFRRSLVVSLHGGGFREFYDKARGPAAGWWIRTVISKAACFIVLTDGWKHWVSSVVPTARVRTIPNVCPDPAWPGTLAEDGIAAPRILFLGRLEREKGFHDLLLAMAILRNRVPGVTLLCGGTGDDGEVARWIESTDTGDSVELRGWVSGAAKRRCFEQAAILVLPSHVENLPMVIIEAMASGLPVVATAVGGIPDVIEHGAEGLLVPPGNPAALADAIAALLLDPAQRQRMALAGRRKYEMRYAPRCVMPQLEGIYRELGLAPCRSGNDRDHA
jgi:glycosyltransferase involved in cell wall biosynthesis